MVGSSLTQGGQELLGDARGLGAYRESGKTFGIPLFAPWANRRTHQFGDVTLVTDGTPGVHPDGNGLPIHGLLAGCPDWQVTRSGPLLTALRSVRGWWRNLTSTSPDQSSRLFPFAHVLTVAGPPR